MSSELKIINQGAWLSFAPKPDITVWELALVLQVMQFKIKQELLTPEIARHFTDESSGCADGGIS